MPTSRLTPTAFRRIRVVVKNMATLAVEARRAGRVGDAVRFEDAVDALLARVRRINRGQAIELENVEQAVQEAAM